MEEVVIDICKALVIPAISALISLLNYWLNRNTKSIDAIKTVQFLLGKFANPVGSAVLLGAYRYELRKLYLSTKLYMPYYVIGIVGLLAEAFLFAFWPQIRVDNNTAVMVVATNAITIVRSILFLIISIVLFYFFIRRYYSVSNCFARAFSEWGKTYMQEIMKCKNQLDKKVIYSLALKKAGGLFDLEDERKRVLYGIPAYHLLDERISKSNNKSCFQPVMDCIMVDDGK